MANRRPLTLVSGLFKELPSGDTLAAALISGLAAIATSGDAGDLSTGSIPSGRYAANTIALDRLSNVAAATFVGRALGAGVGAPVALTPTQAKTALAIASSDVSGLGYFATGTDASNLTGTVAAARIADGSLPIAKIANIATSRILGRITASAGPVEELTGANVATIMGYTAADVLAKLLTVDGAGSGLDADTLDGVSSAGFVAVGSYTAADVLSKLLTVDGTGSGLDADLLDSQSSAYYLDLGNATGTLAAARVAAGSLALSKLADMTTSRVLGRITAGTGVPEELTGANIATIMGYSASDVLTKLLTVDGSGSGLDADLLDGQTGSYYLDLTNATGNLAAARVPTNLLALSKLVQGSSLTVIANATNATANFTELQAAGGDGVVLMRAASALTFSLITGANVTDGTLALTKLANIANGRFLGNFSGSAAAPQEMTAAQVKTNLAIAESDVASLTTDLAARELLSNKSTDGTMAANSVTLYPSQSAVVTYVSSVLAAADVMIFKGVIDASTNPNYPAADKGWLYRISVAGKIGGASGPNVEVGDTILSLADGQSAGNHATVGANWNISQVNLDGAVIGPTSVTSGNPAVFNGTTGKLIQEVSFSSFKTSLAISTGDVSGLSAALALKANLSGPTFTGPVIVNPSGGFPQIQFLNALATLPAGAFRFMGSGNNFLLQRNTAVAGDFSTGTTPLQVSNSDVITFNTTPLVGSDTVWHSGNDGSSSGLDADTVDGIQAASFLLAASYTAADILSKLLTVDGTGTGLDSDLLDGQHGSFYQSASNLNAGSIPAARIANSTITLAMQANIAAATILGNNTGGAAAPIALTVAQTKTLLAIANTDVSGLGTASTVNTGTSGATIPLLNAANTWSARQTYAIASATTAIPISLYNGNTSVGSAIAIDFDVYGAGVGARSAQILGSIPVGNQTDIQFAPNPSGGGPAVQTTVSYAGMYMAGATGGAQGTGTFNATQLYINGNSVGLALLARLTVDADQTVGNVRLIANGAGGAHADGMYIGYNNAGTAAGLTRIYSGGSPATGGGYYYSDSTGQIFTSGGSKYWHATNDGSSSGLDADTVDGLHSTSFALASSLATIATSGSASDLGSGTVPDARISGAYTGITSLTTSAAITVGTVLTGAASNFDIRQNTASASDTGTLRFAGGGAVSTARGAIMQLFGINHATQPGNLFLQVDASASITIAGKTNVSGQLLIQNNNFPQYQTSTANAPVTVTAVVPITVWQHTAAISAIRAVTLSTSNALAGWMLFIVRTGGSTGGPFNLSVNGGDLYATGATGMYVYSGSAWININRGST